MRYLLDTCVISEPVRPRPNRKVVGWLEEADEDALFVSVLTLGEIQKGISKVADEKRKADLQCWLDGELRPRFSDRVLGITDDVALTWGITHGEAELAGPPIPTVDGLIGATAVAHNLTLVTRNVDDFRATGARLFNPWEL